MRINRLTLVAGEGGGKAGRKLKIGISSDEDIVLSVA